MAPSERSRFRHEVKLRSQVERTWIALKVNYGFERAQRKRAKDQKKQEKLRRKEEEAAKRKALKAGESGEASEGNPVGDSGGDPTGVVPATDSPTEAGTN